MNKAKYIFFLILLICLIMPAYHAYAPQSKQIQYSIKEPINLYYIALDSLMPLDQGLNSGIKFISVDIKSCKGLKNKDKKVLLKMFEKYKVKVFNYSLEELGKKGLFDKKNLIIKDGILLSVLDIDVSSQKEIQLGVRKYRSGTGAIGNNYLLKYNNGGWHIIKTISSYIS